MNITSKGARRTLSAVCSAAVVAAGSAFFVSPAFAAGVTLAYGPTATTATITDLDPTASATNAATAYGLKLTGFSDTDATRLAVLSGPTGGAVWAERIATNGSPDTTLTAGTQAATSAPANITTSGVTAANATTVTISGISAVDLTGHAIKLGTQYFIVSSGGGTTTLTLDRAVGASIANTTAVMDLGTAPAGWFPTTVGASTKVFSYAAGDNIYLASKVPGTYTVQLYKDHNGNSAYDASQDDAGPVFTLNVKDVNGITASDTTDDLAPVLSVPSTTGVGLAITPTVNTGLTTVDTRGLVGGVGALGSAIAAASTISFDNGGGIGAGGGASTFDGTYVTETSSASSTAATATTTYSIGSSITRTATTTFLGNTVTQMTEAATDVTGKVSDPATNNNRAIAVKTATPTVAYSATVKDGSNALVSGATVYFTLVTGTNTPALTADGTLVSTTSTTKVYSAVSNSTGVATLNVTAGTTTAGTTYTVTPSTNAVTGHTLTATYADSAATAVNVTNSASSLLVVPGNSATLTGQVVDQFGAAYAPSGSDAVQVAVRMPATGATVGYAAFTSGGNFSYTYTPTTTPTVGTSNTFDFLYAAHASSASAISWASSTAAGKVSITAPVSGATANQQKGTVALAAGTAVTGLVFDSSNATLAYKPVTLTGSDGVYFSTVAAPTTATADDLVKSLTVAANGSGSFTAYAFFTKAGANTIRAVSGEAKASVDVSITQVSDPYKVIAVDTAVAPGGQSVISGRVLNAFGFPVSGATVDLGLGSSTVAALGSASVTTGSDGIWSTTVTGASDVDGAATLTATLHSQVANATPHATWLANAGLTVATGSYQDSATITVDPNINKTTIMAPAARVGAGAVTVKGKAKPGSTVEIYSKITGSSQAYALVGIATASSVGDWSDTEYISKTTTFFAKTSVSTSKTVTVTVKAKPKPKPKPKPKKRR